MHYKTFWLILCCLGGWSLIGLAEAPIAELRVHSSTLVAGHSDPQVLEGAKLYYDHCAVCHGDTLGGLEEARTAFPLEEQHCERCHRRNNARTMSLQQMTWRNAFSIGEAPALRKHHRANALQNFPNRDVLFTYIRTTMPRPFPNSLSDAEYQAITTFLLGVNALHNNHNENVDDHLSSD